MAKVPKKVIRFIKKRSQRNTAKGRSITIPIENFRILDGLSKEMSFSKDEVEMAKGTIIRETLYDTITPVTSEELVKLRRRWYWK